VKFSLEAPVGANQIHAYDDSSVVIKPKNDSDLLIIRSSLILTPDQLITDWPINRIADLSMCDIGYFKSLEPEVLILTQGFSEHVSPEITVKFVDQAIGVEAMLLGPACRTFNLLVAEGRNVVLAVNFD